MEKKPILFIKFDGGENTEDSSDILALNESPEMENADFTRGGSIVKTAGMVELGTDDEAVTIEKLVKASNRNGASWLFKFCGTKLKLYDSVNAVWSTVKTGLTSGKKWWSESFDDTFHLGNDTDDAMSLDIGKITRLDGAVLLGATTIDVDDASQLASSGDVFINSVLVSYTGKTANQLTGCSNAVATPDNYLVSQAFDTHSGTPKGSMSILFGGRLIIAGVSGSGGATVYGSKATDRTDFTVAGGGAADDAFIEALTAQVNSIRKFYDDNSNERIIAFLSDNSIYAIDVDDDATLGTLITAKIFKQHTTAQNHFSTMVGQNDIFHIDLNNQVRTLGPRSQDGSGRNFSDTISAKRKSDLRDNYHFDNASAAIVENEYWLLCRKGTGDYNNTFLIYDQTKHAWRRRTNIIASDVIEFNNKITIADAVSNKVYQITPNELTDLTNPLPFKYNTGDINWSPLNFERLKAVRVAGIMSKDCVITIKAYRDFKGELLGTFTLRGDNADIIGSVLGKSGSFGTVAFGGYPFAGKSASNKRFFIASLELDGLPDFENFRLEITNDQAGVYLEITKIKPFIYVMKEEYFPKQYRILNNN